VGGGRAGEDRGRFYNPFIDHVIAAECLPTAEWKHSRFLLHYVHHFHGGNEKSQASETSESLRGMSSRGVSGRGGGEREFYG
jgi:hypothetical protein